VRVLTDHNKKASRLTVVVTIHKIIHAYNIHQKMLTNVTENFRLGDHLVPNKARRQRGGMQRLLGLDQRVLSDL
jgi:hypothetical protein